MARPDFETAINVAFDKKKIAGAALVAIYKTKNGNSDLNIVVNGLNDLF